MAFCNRFLSGTFGITVARSSGERKVRSIASFKPRERNGARCKGREKKNVNKGVIELRFRFVKTSGMMKKDMERKLMKRLAWSGCDDG
jgi:hypothetical protein